jgi:hypothetical protein
MSEWQPMETAPVGVEVLLYAPAEKPQVFTGMNLCGDWVRTSSGNYAPRDDFFGDRGIKPKRWMPLPPPPQGSKP